MSREAIESDNLRKKLGLLPHPEGGYFRQRFKSKVVVQSLDHSDRRSALTHIHYLLPRNTYSRFHRNRYDEVWNLYSGGGLRLFLVDLSNGSVREEVLASAQCRFDVTIPGGIWQAAEPIGEYALAGCTVAPGWEKPDEDYLSDSDFSDEASALLRLRPDLQRLIHPLNSISA